MKNKTLFVMEKWCDGNPNMGLTASVHNILNTYKKNVGEDFDVLNVDDCFYHGKHVDLHLQEIGHNYNTIIFSFLGDSHMNPSINMCHFLAKKSRLIFIWPDTGYVWAQNRILQLRDYTHISWAGEEVSLGVKDHRFLFTPEDTSLYYPDTKTIPISFIGSLTGYSERNMYLSYLKNNGIVVTVSGGQREHKLTHEQYADLIRKSDIVLNFPESPSGKDQFKGRCLESVASKCLLLSRSSEVTNKFLRDGVDFVSFNSPENLLYIIKWLQTNPYVVRTISQEGYNRFLHDYHPNVFWEKALK